MIHQITVNYMYVVSTYSCLNNCFRNARNSLFSIKNYLSCKTCYTFQNFVSTGVCILLFFINNKEFCRANKIWQMS